MNLKDYLDELLEQNKPIVMSRLVKLSNLGPSDIKLFTAKWGLITVERRRQIITRLEELAETNPELDFDQIFQSCLSDPDPVVRVKAVESLAESEDYQLIDLMARLLKEDNDIAVQAAAAIVLGNFALLAELDKLPAHYATKVRQTLFAAIDSTATDNEVKRRSIEAIAPFSLPQVKGIITKAYHSDDLKTRCSALFAMGRNCDLKWLPILLAELNSSDPELRFEAAQACGEIGNEEAISGLIKVLDDSDIEVRVAAIIALGEIGGKEAKNALLGCLEHSDPVTQEAVEEALAVLEFYQEPLSLTSDLDAPFCKRGGKVRLPKAGKQDAGM